MDYNRTLRYKIEQKIIATIMAYQKEYTSLPNELKLKASNFKDDVFHDLFKNMDERFFAKNKVFDIISLTRGYINYSNSKYNAEQTIISFSTESYNHLHLAEHIYQLKQYAFADRIKEIVNKVQYINIDSSDLEQEYDTLLQEFIDARKIISLDESKNMIESISDVFVLLEENRKKYLNRGTVGVPSGYASIDNFTGGFLEGELSLIGARPSQGKTTIAMNFLQNQALSNFVPLFFSLEMSKKQLILKLMSSHSNVDSKKMFLGKTDKEDFIKLNDAVSQLEHSKIVIEDNVYHLSSIVNKIKYHKANSGIHIVYIDYIQLVRTNSKATREQEVADISRTLKLVAKELNIPIVALAQIGRPERGKTVRRPALHDLRESGALEQDADNVFFVHRPEYYIDDINDVPPELQGVTEFIMRKGRNVGTSIFMLKFKPENSRFEDVSIY